MQNLRLAKNILAVARMLTAERVKPDQSMAQSIEKVLKDLRAMQFAYRTDPQQNEIRLQQLNNVIKDLSSLRDSFDPEWKTRKGTSSKSTID